MCITAYAAQLSGTQIVLGELADQTRYIIYKNNVSPVSGKEQPPLENKDGWQTFRNMMFWPVPGTFDTIQPVETKNLGSCLDDIEQALTPRTRSVVGSRGISGGSGRVKIIETELYTLVIAENPNNIPAALDTNQMRIEGPSGAGYSTVLGTFAELYKSMPVAMMLFKNEEAASGAVLITYRSLPHLQEYYFAPTLDGHGELDLGEWVDTDHMIAIKTPAGKGQKVNYRSLSSVNTEARPYLPENVIGGKFQLALPNGDFWFQRKSVLDHGALCGMRWAPGSYDQNDDTRWFLTGEGIRRQMVEDFAVPNSL
jgi:hypothetical protein